MLAEESFTPGTAEELPADMAERIFQHVHAALETQTNSAGGKIRSLAVMFTDMADSTTFVERYDAQAALDKRQQHNHLLRPLIEAHRGRLIRIIAMRCW
jgi:class 3 adenylate cyclase